MQFATILIVDMPSNRESEVCKCKIIVMILDHFIKSYATCDNPATISKIAIKLPKFEDLKINV